MNIFMKPGNKTFKISSTENDVPSVISSQDIIGIKTENDL